MPPRHLTLHEYRTLPAVALSLEQASALHKWVRDLAVAPSYARPGCFDLTPGSWIGTAVLDDLTIEVLPKIPLDRVLFMVSYALDRVDLGREVYAYAERSSLVELLASLFAACVREAFSRGLLHGYRIEEEPLLTVRGRIRVNDQLRRHFGRTPPIEVSYDDFTVDIEENRLIRAALHALRRSRLRFDRVRRALAALDARLDGVRLVEYDPRRLPEIRYSRLNARYQPAVELARLILRAMTVELGPGATAASTFFVDMNVVFEEFVIRALREALRLSAQELIQGASGRPLFLDRARTIALAPDLMWQGGARCTFVGDVKYKKLYAHAPNADLYQLLAYTIAAGLPAGLLIYAAGEGQPAEHHIVEVGKMIHVVALDLSGSIDEIRTQVERVATLIRELSRQALTPVFAF